MYYIATHISLRTNWIPRYNWYGIGLGDGWNIFTSDFTITKLQTHRIFNMFWNLITGYTHSIATMNWVKKMNLTKFEIKPQNLNILNLQKRPNTSNMQPNWNSVFTLGCILLFNSDLKCELTTYHYFFWIHTFFGAFLYFSSIM